MCCQLGGVELVLCQQLRPGLLRLCQLLPRLTQLRLRRLVRLLLPVQLVQNIGGVATGVAQLRGKVVLCYYYSMYYIIK